MSARLSAVIPCYNEAEGLGLLRARLSALPLRRAGTLEVVLVDDGSADATWPLISAWAAEEAGITAVKLRGNHGNQAAILSGISQARGAAVAVLDADLQDPPEDLEPMLELLEREGAAAVVGIKRRPAEPTWAGWALKWAKVAATLVLPLRLGEGDFCVLSAASARRLLAVGEAWMPFRARRYWAVRGERVLYRPYELCLRAAGSSKIPVLKLARLWRRMFRALYFPPRSEQAFQPPVETVARRAA